MTLTEAPEKTASKPLLETWGKNERMRHIPSLALVIEKLDRDLRRRIETLYSAAGVLPHDDPRRATVEDQVRCVCRAIDRLSEAVRHGRSSHAPNDLGDRLHASINYAVTSLGSLDPNLFGHRYPFQTLDRSRAEIIWSSMLVVVCHVERLGQLIRTIDPNVDEQLLLGLVVLENPVDDRMLQPIVSAN